MLLECKLRPFALNRFHRVTDAEMLYFHLTHVKILSSDLFGFLITRDCNANAYKNLGCFIGLLHKFISLSSKSAKDGRFIVVFFKT